MQLPDRFMKQPRSAQLDAYIKRKYSQYGYPKQRAIEYNPESEENHYRWVEHVSDGLRKVGDAHDIIRLNHTGWYTDEDFGETVKGTVYRLPARGGVEQFVPAMDDPNNDDSALVDFRSVTDCKEDAARWADSMAERFAEAEREYRAKDAAEQRILSINEEIADLYKEFRQIARELRADCDRVQGVQVVRKLVKEKWQRTKSHIHKLKAERKKIEDEGYIWW